MKRDIDLIRKILLQIEEKDIGDGQWVCVDLPEYGKIQINEHIFMLAERGFLTGNDTSSMSDRQYSPRRLTMDGHDFLESIRDEENWKKTKEGALKAGGWTVDLVKDLAKGLIRKKIEEMTSVKL